MKKNKNLKLMLRLLKMSLASSGIAIGTNLLIGLLVVCISLPLIAVPLAYFVLHSDSENEADEKCTCTFLTQEQIDAIEKGNTNEVVNGGSGSAGQGTGDGSVNLPDGLVTAEGLTIPKSGGSQLTGIDNPYGFPLYNGYTKSTPGTEVVVPFSTDTRIEGKVAQAPSYDTYGADSKTVAQRAKENVVTTEFGKDKLYIEDGRLGVALGSGAIAWPDDPDRSASILGVDADIVFKDGTVLPVRMKDAKANKHTGNLHKIYVGGAKAHPDFSIIELYWGLGKSQKYATQTWLKAYGVNAGGIDHIKVYNHKSISYATSTGNYDASTLTGGSTDIPTNNGSNNGNNTTETSLKFNYSNENLDGGEVKPEYVINSAGTASVVSLPITMAGAYPKDSVSADGIVVHFNDGAGTIKGVQQWFNGTNTASHFQIDGTGAIAQYLPLNQYGVSSNSENGKKITIEVANKSLTNAEYTEEAYKSLVHLVAYLSYELGYDLDFNFVNNKAGNLYWDTGTIMRHYDTKSGNNQYAKACPAYWVPNDGSISNGGGRVDTYLKNAGTGGNTRWISFKVEVANYIMKYKNDSNFSVKMEDGSDILGLDWAKTVTTGKYDWKNANQSTGTDNTEYTSGNGNKKYTTKCYMDIDGHCGCYIRDPNCKCGCKAESSQETEQKNDDNKGTAGGEVSYDANNGLKVPATQQYTMDDVKSTGAQRVIDSAMVTFQAMYKLGSHNLDKVPLYTWNIKSLSYNYTGLAQVGYKTADGLVTVGKWDCSSYVCAVLNNMGISKYHQQATGTLLNMDLTEFGFTRIMFSKEALQPGDIVVKSGHTEIFVGWADDAHKQSYVWSWGGSERKANYNDGKGVRGLPHDNTSGVSGYPGANNNGVDSLITGPRLVTQGNYTVIFRYTGK